MKRSWSTEDQIIAVRRERKAGVKTAEVYRKHGVSEATFYTWTVKYEVAPEELGSVHDAQYAVADVIAAAAGQITLSGAAELVRVIEVYIKTFEASDRETQKRIGESHEDDPRDERDRRR